jgi:hypothetical protein
MPLAFTLPEDLKIVEGLAPQIGAGAPLVSDYVSVKNLQKLFVVIHYAQGDATDTTWRVMRDISVAGAASVVLVNNMVVWSNLNTAVSDTLVRRGDAVNYAGGVGVANKLIIFQIDPASLGMDANGVPYDCVCAETVQNVAATSTATVLFVGVPRYAAPVDMQPSIIID